jgi:hypothetical protein
VPLGDPATVEVRAADGSTIATLSETTVARLYDLALDAGIHPPAHPAA